MYFVPKDPVENNATLIQAVAWRRQNLWYIWDHMINVTYKKQTQIARSFQFDILENDRNVSNL